MLPFTKLKVWLDARKVTAKVYRLTASFPGHELYGLTSQLRRAAVSVTANIAEGSKKDSRLDYARYLNLAEGSCAEVQSLAYVANDLGYLNVAQLRELLLELESVSRMLHALKRTVRQKRDELEANHQTG